MDLDNLLNILLDREVMVPLLGSLVAGTLIGAEREYKGKPAGLRTHALVCLASALMTLTALRMAEWTILLQEDTRLVSDLARMPHAILTGIGFLGAGVIFREGFSVQGLTTAASLWITAAIGITFATGLIELAVISTVLSLAVLIILRVTERIAPLKPEFSIEIVVDASSEFSDRNLFELLEKQGLKAAAPSMLWSRKSFEKKYKMLAAAQSHRYGIDELAKTLRNEKAVKEFIISPIAYSSSSGRRMDSH